MNMETLTLDKLTPGSCAHVKNIKAVGETKRRLYDLGFIRGTLVKALRKSPGGDPHAYFLRGTVIALRQEDAAKIELFSGGEENGSD